MIELKIFLIKEVIYAQELFNPGYTRLGEGYGLGFLIYSIMGLSFEPRYQLGEPIVLLWSFFRRTRIISGVRASSMGCYPPHQLWHSARPLYHVLSIGTILSRR